MAGEISLIDSEENQTVVHTPKVTDKSKYLSMRNCHTSMTVREKSERVTKNVLGKIKQTFDKFVKKNESLKVGVGGESHTKQKIDANRTEVNINTAMGLGILKGILKPKLKSHLRPAF